MQKNQKLDIYYKMRQLDKQLQKLYAYSENQGIDSGIAREYFSRKHECLFEILNLIKDLGLPSAQLQAYIKEQNLEDIIMSTTKKTTSLSTEEE